MNVGKVYLVGAGPGDQALITVKGKTAIKNAEVILYDRLVNPKLLEFASDECELVYCGKLPDRHILRQEAINELLIQYAKQGKIVVRLKGGDPSVFGRVGEEASELALAQIPFEIIPGITSGIAASLYAGIPVTHREYGESFAVVTAHDKSLSGKPSIDWQALVNGIATIAFYMGVANLPYICENLIKFGKPADTPVILIQWGTLSRQKTLQGTLSTIAELAEREKFRNPAITLVGNIVSLRDKMNWFEQKPLFGRQIIVCKKKNDNHNLATQLTELGADVVELPKWIKSSKMTGDKRRILEKISQFNSLIFTSVDSAIQFFEDMKTEEIDFRSIQGSIYGYNNEIVQIIKNHGLSASIIDNKTIDNRSVLEIGALPLEALNSVASKFFKSHEENIDSRFYSIHSRMLEEATYDTIIFQDKQSLATLKNYFQSLGKDFTEYVTDKKIICIGSDTFKKANDLQYNSVELPKDYSLSSLLKEL
ncbi:uroporphyrinogen-III C-methyltransferase [Metabacillus malikii]|uniref:uroporphyrinogen-III C-methyltransferase n=1 Tax=Metabacillus malikii TaxID=1504265 RepID=A0ABT9ZDF6_9BACI|nr:uroporphyrinogen-III C-methyltransferase [Metabacillus malikii]MDQ0229969.1 uroporphyrinogen III methyltransferase/synthase [Metabacillus malikii]